MITSVYGGMKSLFTIRKWRNDDDEADAVVKMQWMICTWDDVMNLNQRSKCGRYERKMIWLWSDTCGRRRSSEDVPAFVTSRWSFVCHKSFEACIVYTGLYLCSPPLLLVNGCILRHISFTSCQHALPPCAVSRISSSYTCGVYVFSSTDGAKRCDTNNTLAPL